MTTIIKDSLSHFRTNLQKSDTDISSRTERANLAEKDSEQSVDAASVNVREPLFTPPLSAEQASKLAGMVAQDISLSPETALLAHRASINAQALLRE